MLPKSYRTASRNPDEYGKPPVHPWIADCHALAVFVMLPEEEMGNVIETLYTSYLPLLLPGTKLLLPMYAYPANQPPFGCLFWRHGTAR